MEESVKIKKGAEWFAVEREKDSKDEIEVHLG